MYSHSPNEPHWVMDIIQLLITVGAVVGVIVIGLLAIVPSLLDYPRGLDRGRTRYAGTHPAAPPPAADTATMATDPGWRPEPRPGQNFGSWSRGSWTRSTSSALVRSNVLARVVLRAMTVITCSFGRYWTSTPSATVLDNDSRI